MNALLGWNVSKEVGSRRFRIKDIKPPKHLKKNHSDLLVDLHSCDVGSMFVWKLNMAYLSGDKDKANEYLNTAALKLSLCLEGLQEFYVVP